MKPPASVLLLVGSPKKGTSTSEALGSYLLDKLCERGIAGTALRVHRVLGAAGPFDAALAAIERADLVVLASPLYVDSLPSHVMEALERIAAARHGKPTPTGQRFACIMNCGFPEAHHNNTAIRICAAFAREAGFEWAGGLALGGGETIGGKALAKMGGIVRHVVSGLDVAAHALAEGRDIPAAAANALAKPFLPVAAFRLVAGGYWLLRARRYGTQWRLKARPYEQKLRA